MTARLLNSDNRRSGRFLLIASVLGLALLNWSVLTSEIDISPVVPDDAGAADQIASIGGLPAEGGDGEPGAYPQMLARPLFRSSRRPPDPARTAARAEAAPRPVAKLPENLELVGIMKESGRQGRALIRVDDSSPGQWVEIGHVLQGWRLSRIDGASISFEAEGREQRLSLYPTPSPKNE